MKGYFKIYIYLFFSIPVSLQPFEFDPNEKNKHKFMVLTTIAPEGEINFDNIVSLEKKKKNYFYY